jgi:hypothetical protein
MKEAEDVFMTTLGKVVFLKDGDEDPGKWVLWDFDGFLLVEIPVEVPGVKGVTVALKKVKEECQTRFPNARLYPRSAEEYLVIK